MKNGGRMRMETKGDAKVSDETDLAEGDEKETAATKLFELLPLMSIC